MKRKSNPVSCACMKSACLFNTPQRARPIPPQPTSTMQPRRHPVLKRDNTTSNTTRGRRYPFPASRNPLSNPACPALPYTVLQQSKATKPAHISHLSTLRQNFPPPKIRHPLQTSLTAEACAKDQSTPLASFPISRCLALEEQEEEGRHHNHHPPTAVVARGHHSIPSH